jgi:hypothetical protein
MMEPPCACGEGGGGGRGATVAELQLGATTSEVPVLERGQHVSNTCQRAQDSGA